MAVCICLCLQSIIHSSANDNFLHSVESASDFFQHRAPFYHRLPVFLQTDECAFSPHICHCVELMPGISLVILNEVGLVTDYICCFKKSVEYYSNFFFKFKNLSFNLNSRCHLFTMVLSLNTTSVGLCVHFLSDIIQFI